MGGVGHVDDLHRAAEGAHGHAAAQQRAGCSRRDRRPAGSAARRRTAPARAGRCTPAPCREWRRPRCRARRRRGRRAATLPAAAPRRSRRPGGRPRADTPSCPTPPWAGPRRARTGPRSPAPAATLASKAWRAAGSAGALSSPGGVGGLKAWAWNATVRCGSTAACETGWLKRRSRTTGRSWPPSRRDHVVCTSRSVGVVNENAYGWPRTAPLAAVAVASMVTS